MTGIGVLPGVCRCVVDSSWSTYRIVGWWCLRERLTLFLRFSTYWLARVHCLGSSLAETFAAIDMGD